jgi:hypothetical protein
MPNPKRRTRAPRQRHAAHHAPQRAHRVRLVARPRRWHRRRTIPCRLRRPRGLSARRVHEVGRRCTLAPPDPQLKGAWYPGGFNPRTYQVKNRFQTLRTKCNLHRYTWGVSSRVSTKRRRRSRREPRRGEARGREREPAEGRRRRPRPSPSDACSTASSPPVGLHKLNPVDPWLEGAWFPTLEPIK